MMSLDPTQFPVRQGLIVGGNPPNQAHRKLNGASSY